MEEKIISKVLSAQGRLNYDVIYQKKSAHEWLEELYAGKVKILDADGWRYNDGVTLDSPINKKEFMRRFNECTVSGLVGTII